MKQGRKCCHSFSKERPVMATKTITNRNPSGWIAFLVVIIVILSSGCSDNGDDDNKAPVARATATPDTVEVNYEVKFSAKGSSDPDDDTLTYHWDFDASDGANDIDSIKKEPSYSYSETGTYTITLTVSDGDLSDKDTVKVTVTKPQGDLTATITTEDETRGTVHETENDPGTIREETMTVRFSGEESEDTNPESDIQKYEWDYVLEGEFEADESGETGRYDYKSGRYTVMLQVTNTTDKTARDSMYIMVNYNESYNRSGSNQVEAGENQTFRFPVNTLGAVKLEVSISYEVTDIGGLDEDDLELYLYDVGDNEIANTENQENGSEVITIGYCEIYQNGLENSLGAWRAVVENENSVVDKDFWIYIDVMYYTP